jgi:hypothetical protein
VRCCGPVTARRRPRILSVLALSLVLTPGLAGCKDKPSNLEKLGGEKSEAESGQPQVASTGEAPVAAETDPVLPDNVPDIPETELPVDKDGLPIPALDGAAKLLSPGAEDQRVELRLALADEARYRITTIGMLKLPLFDKPVGFAREEDLRLGDCSGEGRERSCLITHTYRNFEAEPPTGEALEKDEAFVAKLETSHRIDSTGLRISETAISGTVDNPAGQALTQVHRLYCIRLPDEPVGIGATWRDTCRNRLGGAVITRELVWRLAKLEKTEEGTRAELEYAGRVRRIDPGGELRVGEVKGALYFWVDAGEPHLLRERVAFILDAERGMSTGTDLRYQFAKLGDKDELIRTDGKPFDGSPVVLNDPRSVPPGDTRDAEHAGKPKPKPN